MENERYDLVSVLYHTLQEAETLTSYIEDARRSGDRELAAFLENVQEQDRERAEQAKRMLAGRLSPVGG
jgi:hypothetical protein